MKIKALPSITLAILVFSLVNSHHLFRSWFNTPIENFSGLIFFLWILPLPVFWFCKSKQENPWTTANTFLSWLYLLFGLISIVTSLNAIAYVGLAFACSTLIPWLPVNYFWLIASISWMPAFGWYLTHQFPQVPIISLSIFRIILAVSGSLLVLYKLTMVKKSYE